MHAFVAAVLLRRAGPHARDRDAEAEPPDREPGEIVKAVGTGEGEPVVAPDGNGEAALAERLLEGLDDRGFPRRFKSFAQERVARGLVGDGQGG